MHIERGRVGIEDYVRRCGATLVPILVIRMEIFLLLQLTFPVASEDVVEMAIWLIYHMESKLAQFPRILVSDAAIQALKEAPVLRGEGNSFREEMSYLKKFLRRDEDGLWFLDYLAVNRNEHYE
jgi:hypothetical protein